MKRIAALVLVLALMFSFTACQNGDKNVNANQTAEPVATKTPEEISNAAQEITGAKEYKSVYRTSFNKSYASFNYFSTPMMTKPYGHSKYVKVLNGWIIPAPIQAWKLRRRTLLTAYAILGIL